MLEFLMLLEIFILLVLIWSSKQTEKHRKIQNHSKFLFHTEDRFVLCPPAEAGLLGGNEMFGL